MIKTLTIDNFLSHKKTEMEFVPGVNVIVGGTDTGKSAIVRALKWVIENRPTGDSFRSYWGGDTKVVIDVGQEVGRFRTDKVNQYHLKGLEFNAVKTEVPEEVVQVLNFNAQNLQTQFESHFLLSSTPGAVASYFNQIAHLDKIDLGLSNLQSWIRDLNHSIKNNEEYIQKLDSDLEEFDSLDEIEKVVRGLEETESKVNSLGLENKDLRVILNKESAISKLERMEMRMISLEPLLSKVYDLADELNVVQKSNSTLYELVDKVKKIEVKIDEVKKFTGMEKSFNSLVGLIEQLQEKKGMRSKLEGLLEENSSIIERYEIKYRKLKDLEFDWHESFGEGKECPLCGAIQ